ncbi:MAG: hypothetical protein IT343_13355 [Candidatus Melainabacteria bacterium]|jgi:hypothetical protein|nr:hypothetical protein [Candidatus Melainabacteria bacterium]
MEIFQDPLILVCVLAMPLVIIGLAKAWKRLKDKKAEAAAAGGGSSSDSNG